MSPKNRGKPSAPFINPHADALLDQFCGADDPQARHMAAEELARGKHVNAVRNDARFESGINQCLSYMSRPDDVLTGISMAYRLGSASKPAMALVRKLAIGRIDRPLPPLSLLPNAKDRYYVALALADADGDWLAAYIARSIAEDEAAELARVELVRQLLRRTSLGDALCHVAQAMRDIGFGTAKPAESAARRLRRVIAAFRPSVMSDQIELGRNGGTALKQLFDTPARLSGFNPGEKPWLEAAEAACGLVGDVLRTQLSLLAEPDVYLSLQAAAIWVDVRLWSRFIDRSKSAALVLNTLLAAITLLAKQRVTDHRLLAALEFIAGGRGAAARYSATLAASPGLDAHVSEWLRQMGRDIQIEPLHSFRNADESEADEHIAALMTLTLSWADDPGRDSVSRRAGREVERLARARAMSIKHVQGEAVEYLPSAHELVGGHRMGVRRVRILQPLVVRTVGDALVIVQKAIVEVDMEN